MPGSPSEKLAAYGYFHMIEEIADIQKQLVMLDLLQKRFGKRALPPIKLFRSHRDTIRDAPERCARMKARWEERLPELYKQCEELEALFVEARNADMDEWAKYFAERFRQREGL